jgi:uncharacterized protein
MSQMNDIEYIGKCVFIQKEGKKIVVIGDLHLGYEASLNAAGVFVTRTLFKTMIEELEQIFLKIGHVDEVVLLGDIKHAFGRILKEEWKETDLLINFLREKSRKIIVIKGNHDALTDIIGKRLGFEVVDIHLTMSLAFIHGDRDFSELWKKEVNTVFLGHLHPAILLSDGVKREKYKCFLEGTYKSKNFVILPSFIGAQEGTDPRDFDSNLPWKLQLSNFEVILIGENLENYNFGKLGSL